MMASVRISLGHPSLNAFSSNLDSSTKNKITSAGSGGYILLQATLSPSEILFLAGLSGNIRVTDNFYLNDVYLSLSVTLPATGLEFGFVGMVSMKLGTEVVAGVEQPVLLYTLVQVFIDIGPAGPGLGFMTAFCRTPWEVIPGIHLLFPAKLKVVINLLSGFPTMIAFAGGFRLGNEEANALTAYSQVMVQDDSFSVYFSMQDVSFGNLIRYFVGDSVELPDSVANMLSIGSAVVSFNPDGSGAAATALTEAPEANSLVATSNSDCANVFNLLTFAPLPTGVSSLFFLLLLVSIVINCF